MVLNLYGGIIKAHLWQISAHSVIIPGYRGPKYTVLVLRWPKNLNKIILKVDMKKMKKTSGDIDPLYPCVKFQVNRFRNNGDTVFRRFDRRKKERRKKETLRIQYISPYLWYGWNITILPLTGWHTRPGESCRSPCGWYETEVARPPSGWFEVNHQLPTEGFAPTHTAPSHVWEFFNVHGVWLSPYTGPPFNILSEGRPYPKLGTHFQ